MANKQKSGMKATEKVRATKIKFKIELKRLMQPAGCVQMHNSEHQHISFSSPVVYLSCAINFFSICMIDA